MFIKNRKINNIIISTVIISAAFIHVSTASFAASVEMKKSAKVSFEFNDVKLTDMLQLVMMGANTIVASYDAVPDLNASLTATEVDNERLKSYLLRCSGLSLKSNDDGEYIIEKSQHKSRQEIIDCVQAFDA